MLERLSGNRLPVIFIITSGKGTSFPRQRRFHGDVLMTCPSRLLTLQREAGGSSSQELRTATCGSHGVLQPVSHLHTDPRRAAALWPFTKEDPNLRVELASAHAARQDPRRQNPAAPHPGPLLSPHGRAPRHQVHGEGIKQGPRTSRSVLRLQRCLLRAQSKAGPPGSMPPTATSLCSSPCAPDLSQDPSATGPHRL